MSASMVIGQVFKKISIYKYFYYILNEMSTNEISEKVQKSLITQIKHRLRR
jgi:hypothetical protein